MALKFSTKYVSVHCNASSAWAEDEFCLALFFQTPFSSIQEHSLFLYVLQQICNLTWQDRHEVWWEIVTGLWLNSGKFKL